jgi:hypothetical protein
MTVLALKHGARVDECVHYNELSGNLLHLACKYAEYEKVLSLHEHTQVIRYLLEIGSDMEYRNMYGRTPLLEASAMRFSRDSDVSSALLAEGADSSVADLEGRNALHLTADALQRRNALGDAIDASLLGVRPEGDLYHRLVELLRAGCDPLAMDHVGQTPSSYVQHSPIAWVVWARALYEVGWSPEAIDELVPNPIVPMADIKYRLLLSRQWHRPHRTEPYMEVIQRGNDGNMHLAMRVCRHRLVEVQEIE